MLGTRLARLIDAEPIVVSVVPWPDYLTSVADLERHLESELENALERLEAELGDVRATPYALAGRSPAQVLSETAEREGALAIVIGSAHRGPLGRTLLGTTGESLMQGASCAVAIAPRDHGPRRSEQLRKIAVAFDGSTESWVALDTAIALARLSGGRLTALAVADYPHYGYPSALAVLSSGELGDLEREEKERLLSLAANRMPSDVDGETRLLTGKPGRALAEASAEFDLMVAGSRGFGPLRRTLLGSTTSRLARSAACAVLVLPRGVGADPLALRELAGDRARAGRPGG